MYDEKEFGKRMNELRIIKGVSARDMSLSIGQSESYMNKIENSKSFPSMEMFFYICDYLKISPRDFFDHQISNPKLIKELIDDLNKIETKYIVYIHEIIKALAEKNK